MHPTIPGPGVVLDKSLAPKHPEDLRGKVLPTWQCEARLGVAGILTGWAIATYPWILHGAQLP